MNLKKFVGKTKIIYRIQDQNRLGPYRNEAIRYEILDSHSNGDGRRTHPTPCDDMGRYIEKYEKCGFLSLHFLLKWFSPMEIQKLEKKGYFITPVKGMITSVGNFQVLFEEVA